MEEMRRVSLIQKMRKRQVATLCSELIEKRVIPT